MNRDIDAKTYIENAEKVVINNSEKVILPSNIPSPKDFIGRVAELNVLRNAKAEGKTSFVLHGIGGVGKTDLALEFIKGIKPEFEKHFRVDMFGLNDNPKSIRDAKLEIIRAFGQEVSPDISDADANQIYVALINQHKTILFFDNAKDRN
ncbi:MAG: ATP-binding protein, partial [Pyrinomonadaceae bacterium]|nr:ATP-binding protein [Pyrinomonadaceae bacterium]